MNITIKTICLVLVLCTLQQGANATIGSKERVLEPGNYVTLDWFGFLQSGHASLSLSALNNTAACDVAVPAFRVMLCDINTLHDLNGQFTSVEQLCQADDLLAGLQCPVNEVLGCKSPNKLDLEYSGYIDEGNVYFLTLLNCGNGVFTVSAQYEFVNPGGDHLGTQNMYLPYIYSGFLFLWLFPAAALLYEIVKNRKHEHVFMSILLCAPVAAKFAVLTVSTVYWFSYRNEGYVDKGMILSLAGVYGLFKAALIFYLMVVGKGYIMVFEKLEFSEWSTICCYSILALLNWTLQILFQSSQILMIILFFGFVIILRGVIVASSQTIRDLQFNRALILIHDPGQERVVHKLIRRYRSFQTTFVAWIVLDIMIKSISYFVFAYMPWIVKTDEEVLDLALLLGVWLSFKTGPDRVGVHANDDLEMTPLSGGESKRPPNFLVVQNPPTKDDSGVLRPSVAIATITHVGRDGAIHDQEVDRSESHPRFVDETDPNIPSYGRQDSHDPSYPSWSRSGSHSALLG